MRRRRERAARRAGRRSSGACVTLLVIREGHASPTFVSRLLAEWLDSVKFPSTALAEDLLVLAVADHERAPVVALGDEELEADDARVDGGEGGGPVRVFARGDAALPASEVEDRVEAIDFEGEGGVGLRAPVEQHFE